MKYTAAVTAILFGSAMAATSNNMKMANEKMDMQKRQQSGATLGTLLAAVEQIVGKIGEEVEDLAKPAEDLQDAIKDFEDAAQEVEVPSSTSDSSESTSSSSSDDESK